MFNVILKPSFHEKVRLKWLRGRVDEDDGESDGETAALRESLQVMSRPLEREPLFYLHNQNLEILPISILRLQQLSNASSPAESVVSTSSNPGHSLGSSGASSRSVQPQLFGWVIIF